MSQELLQQHLSLWVLGTEDTVKLFRLMGAKGRVIQGEEQLYTTVKDLEGNSKTIGGILIDSSLYDEQSRGYQRLKKSDLPFVILPSLNDDNGAGFMALEQLAVKAMGMKLNL